MYYILLTLSVCVFVKGLEHLSSSVCFASSLDETLDREVLLLLQGPTPEQLSLEFKTLISRLVTKLTSHHTHSFETNPHLHS